MLCLMMLGAERYAFDALLFKCDPPAVDRGASSTSRGSGEP